MIALCFLCSTTYAQVTFINTKHDKFEEETVYSTKLLSSNTGIELKMGAFFKKKDNIDALPPVVQVSFLSMSKDWLFLEDYNLIFLADSQRFRPIDSKAERQVRSGFVTEEIENLFTTEDFLKLAKSNDIEAKLGNVEFKLTDEQKKAIQAIAELIKALPTSTSQTTQPQVVDNGK